MERYVGMTEKTEEASEDKDRASAELEEVARSYVFTGLSVSLDAEAGETLPYVTAAASAPRHEPGVHAEVVGGYIAGLPHHLVIGRLRERVPDTGGRHAVGSAEEPDPEAPVGDGERPEVEALVDKLLATGGKEIVKRLKEQEAEIAKAECRQPEFGKLVEAYHVPLLLAALALGDEEFDAEYPGDAPVSFEQRAELAETLLRHSQDCPRCSLKVSSDREWEEHVNEVFSLDGRRFRLRV